VNDSSLRAAGCDATYRARLGRLVHGCQDPLLVAGAELTSLRFLRFRHHLRIGDAAGWLPFGAMESNWTPPKHQQKNQGN